MLILSIDVGIKNLALCIADVSNNKDNIICWDIINLCNEEILKCNYCTKKAIYTKENKCFCTKHAKQSKYSIPKIDISKLGKLKKTDLITYSKSLNLFDDKILTKEKHLNKIKDYYFLHFVNKITTVKTSEFSLIDLGKNLNDSFNKLMDKNCIDENNLKTVIIENQISPIANRMKSLQCMIAQYFITKNIQHIEFISAQNKLSKFINKPTEYSERKKLSIEITSDLLSKHNEKWKQMFNTHKKRDDLADSYLQLLWYINK